LERLGKLVGPVQQALNLFLLLVLLLGNHVMVFWFLDVFLKEKWGSFVINNFMHVVYGFAGQTGVNIDSND
jgi:hypothetical protein